MIIFSSECTHTHTHARSSYVKGPKIFHFMLFIFPHQQHTHVFFLLALVSLVWLSLLYMLDTERCVLFDLHVRDRVEILGEQERKEEKGNWERREDTQHFIYVWWHWHPPPTPETELTIKFHNCWWNAMNSIKGKIIPWNRRRRDGTCRLFFHCRLLVVVVALVTRAIFVIIQFK